MLNTGGTEDSSPSIANNNASEDSCPGLAYNASTGGLMVSAFNFGASGPGSSPDRGHFPLF